jgi:hypothetical protein
VFLVASHMIVIAHLGERLELVAISIVSISHASSSGGQKIAFACCRGPKKQGQTKIGAEPRELVDWRVN